jgi:hypothetical protein
MQQRLNPATRRALAGGLALTAASAGTASAQDLRHGIGLGIAMLLTVLLVAAIVHYGARDSRSHNNT